MKKVEVRTYNMGESLFNAILFFILGIILFTNPNGIVKVLIYIIGGISILIGIFKLLMCYKLPQTKENQKEIVNGLVYMIIGMVTIVCAIIFFDAVENVLRLTFAVFLLYVGINRFINAFKAPKGRNNQNSRRIRKRRALRLSRHLHGEQVRAPDVPCRRRK